MANTSTFAIFSSRAGAETAVDALRAAGFRSEDVSVLFADNQGSKDFAHEKNTKAPEGATTGGVAGPAAGGILGWLVGMGSLAIPGVGPFIAAGPIIAALAGLGAGATIGGVAGALIGMGIPEFEAKRYEGIVKKGGVLLSVHCDNATWTKRAKEILEANGGDSISSTGESADIIKGTKTDKPIPRVGVDLPSRDIHI